VQTIQRDEAGNHETFADRRFYIKKGYLQQVKTASSYCSSLRSYSDRKLFLPQGFTIPTYSERLQLPCVSRFRNEWLNRVIKEHDRRFLW